MSWVQNENFLILHWVIYVIFDFVGQISHWYVHVKFTFWRLRAGCVLVVLICRFKRYLKSYSNNNCAQGFSERWIFQFTSCLVVGLCGRTSNVRVTDYINFHESLWWSTKDLAGWSESQNVGDCNFSFQQLKFNQKTCMVPRQQTVPMNLNVPKDAEDLKHPKDPSQILCRYFKLGRCTRNDCTFSHDLQLDTNENEPSVKSPSKLNEPISTNPNSQSTTEIESKSNSKPNNNEVNPELNSKQTQTQTPIITSTNQPLDGYIFSINFNCVPICSTELTIQPSQTITFKVSGNENPISVMNTIAQLFKSLSTSAIWF